MRVFHVIPTKVRLSIKTTPKGRPFSFPLLDPGAEYPGWFQGEEGPSFTIFSFSFLGLLRFTNQSFSRNPPGNQYPPFQISAPFVNPEEFCHLDVFYQHLNFNFAERRLFRLSCTCKGPLVSSFFFLSVSPPLIVGLKNRRRFRRRLFSTVLYGCSFILFRLPSPLRLSTHHDIPPQRCPFLFLCCMRVAYLRALHEVSPRPFLTPPISLLLIFFFSLTLLLSPLDLHNWIQGTFPR